MGNQHSTSATNEHDPAHAKFKAQTEAHNAMNIKISKDVSELHDFEWDVVVIGSGYGGSIAASRLSRAGKKVCLLEMGKEFRPGQYPDTLWEATHEFQVHKDGKTIGRPNGLYDLYANNEVNVLKGCGLGGTSLINANVVLKSDPRVFENAAWPQAVRDEIHGKDKPFDRWYTLVTDMLEPSPYPAHRTLPKILAMEEAVVGSTGGRLYRPPIAVNFEDKVNKVGLHQPACTDCGDCISGCNVGAKNTLLMNYLPDAHQHGCHIFTGTQVRSISKRKDGHEGWTVWFRALDARELFPDKSELFVNAKVVVLSAGTLGSTEILLRSKERGLPLSEFLGSKFSGNGDLLGFAFNTAFPIEQPTNEDRKVGPCITSVIDRRSIEGEDVSLGFVVEDGTHPIAVAKVYGSMLSLLHPTCKESFSDFLKETGHLLVDAIEVFRHSLSFLVMAQDSSHGSMRLKEDSLSIEWPGAPDEPFVQHAYDYLNSVIEKLLKGHLIKNPITSSLLPKKQLITVHPLGGCVMGDNVATSVVNHKSQVWDPTTPGAVHHGLYVMDGSVIPCCVGVNPFFTISAFAERAVHLLAEDFGWPIKQGFAWQAESPHVRPGITFTERMAGWFSVGEKHSFEDGKKEGKKSGCTIEFVFTISSRDVEALIASPDHSALITGTIRAPIVSQHDLQVLKGQFNFFVDDPARPGEKVMKYRAIVADEAGKRYLFTGFKIAKNNLSGLNTWSQCSTLYVTLYHGDEEKEEAITGKGIMYISTVDFAKQLTTLSIINAPDRPTRLKLLAKFGKFFAGSLWDVYTHVGSTAGSHTEPRKKRPLNLPVPEIYDVVTEDHLTLRLTRYAQPHGAAGKGPLLAVHGMGVSARLFTMDTVQVNFAEYFHAQGYDVWLLDFRLSCDLPYAPDVTDLDRIGHNDFLPAIDKVLEVTGVKDIAMLVHCVGAITFFLGMTKGLFRNKIRCLITTNFVLHAVTGSLKTSQSELHFAETMGKLGLKLINPSVDDGLFNDVIGTQLVADVPSSERCSNPTCHRISFMYGQLWQHENLTATSHAVMNEYFGPGAVKAFAHLSNIVRAGHLVDANGHDVYLPTAAENLKLPMLMMNGKKNAIWHPECTEQSYRFLCDANGPQFYKLYLVPGYGQLEVLMGKNAHVDVFPKMLEFLDQHPVAPAAAAAAAAAPHPPPAHS